MAAVLDAQTTDPQAGARPQAADALVAFGITGGDAPPPVHPYAPGSWGPAEAGRLVTGVGRWHDTWVAS
jgi:hypothetical protein